MSATGRSAAAETGHVRHPDDFYATPTWCTKAMLPALHLSRATRVLEPSAGQGAIVDVLLTAIDRSQVHAIEVDADRWSNVAAKCKSTHADFLELAAPAKLFDLVITNPPFQLAMEFVQHAMRFVRPRGEVAMLLRLNWLASLKRAEFLRRFCPDVYVLPRRPSFTGRGTDATEYGWFVWRGLAPRATGVVQVLDLDIRTPRAIALRA
jgi:hypothetical protein